MATPARANGPARTPQTPAPGDLLSAQKVDHQLVDRIRGFAGRKMAHTGKDMSRITAAKKPALARGRIRQGHGVGSALDHEGRNGDRLRLTHATVESTITRVLIRLAPTYAVGMPCNFRPVRVLE